MRSAPVNYADLSVNVLHLGVVIRNLLNNFLHGILHDVVIVVHHHNLALRNQLNALDLVVVDNELLIVLFLSTIMELSLSHTPPGFPGRGSRTYQRLMLTSSSSMESVTVMIRVLA